MEYGGSRYQRCSKSSLGEERRGKAHFDWFMTSPPDRRLDRGQTAQKTLHLPPSFFSTLLPSDLVLLLMCSFAYCLPPLWERSLPERWDLAMHTRTASEQAPGLGQALSSRPCRCVAQSSAVTRRPRRKKKILGKNLVLSLGKQYHCFYMCKAFLWRNVHRPRPVSCWDRGIPATTTTLAKCQLLEKI